MEKNLHFSTAVLFLVFNRPDTTKQVFEQIRIAKPPRLYIASDGPRSNKFGEKDTVDSVRNYVLQNVDWECEVKTLFRDVNLGCKYAVSGAISWFFEHEEQGIILEDDCLPSTSFFSYCENMLECYKDDDKVMMISGNNFIDSDKIKQDYYFLTIPHIWGWATWRRAWDLYDVEFFRSNSFNNNNLPQFMISDRSFMRFWRKIFIFAHNINTWDYQLVFTLFKHGGLCINPKYNLISNIGFGVDATHTSNQNDSSANLHRYEFVPDYDNSIKYNKKFDELDSLACGFYSLSFFQRGIRKVARLFNK